MDYTNTIDRLNKAGKLCQDAAEAIAVLTAKAERLEQENTQLRTEQEQRPYKFAPIDQYDGLKRKYVVLKADTGEYVENCFVLRPDRDAAAVVALRAYAGATDNKTLAADIINWVGAAGGMMDHKEQIDRLEQENRRLQELTHSQRNGLEQFRGELANYEQITDWLRRNGFESFEALTEAFEQVKRERADLKNELCCKCGNYKQAHNGGCDHCRWKEE